MINCYKPSCSEQKLTRSHDLTILFIQSDGNQALGSYHFLAHGGGGGGAGGNGGIE